MYNDFLRDECLSLITRISCLLVYYEFELSERLEVKFQNSKILFYLGDDFDLPTVFFDLYSIECQLLIDILEFYEPYWGSELIIDIWS
jgi:hypothetical protein